MNYYNRRRWKRGLARISWMAAGAAIAVFALPLMPTFARPFIDNGQLVVVSVFKGLDGSENSSGDHTPPTSTPERPKTTMSSALNPSGMLPTALPKVATKTIQPTMTPIAISVRPIQAPMPVRPPVPTVIITQHTTSPIPTVHPPEPDLDVAATEEPDLQGMREFMLSLINQARTSNGLGEVQLGTNSAAQLHAEEMAAQGFLGHWGLDGRKSYMRYADAGGTQYSAENVFGPDEYISLELGFRSSGPKALLEEAMESLMASSGHRDNILKPKHRKVNLGIAYNGASVSVVQQFEGDYIGFLQEPILENGLLSFSGSMNGDLELTGVHIYFDPLPIPASKEQINATYCVDGGTPIGLFRPPLRPREYYTEHFTDLRYPFCPSPHDIDLSREQTYTFVLYANAQTLPWITAERWSVEDGEFVFEGELSDLVEQQGDGVYVVNIWADDGGGSILVANYPIYVESE